MSNGYDYDDIPVNTDTTPNCRFKKWMLAVVIVCNAKKGVSEKQLQRDMGVRYKTAWYLAQRFRKA